MFVEEFAKMLPEICTRETSADPDLWSPENPLWGHCAVVTLLAQDYFGGSILRADIQHVPEFARMRSHYQNYLPCGDGGLPMDFTAAQFKGRYPQFLCWEERTRASLFANEHTARRYLLLKARAVAHDKL